MCIITHKQGKRVEDELPSTHAGEMGGDRGIRSPEKDSSMSGLNKKNLQRVLAVLLAVIVVGGVVHAVSIDVFNKTEHSVQGADTTQATYLSFNDREDSTSTWVKRDYNLNGKKVDLLAQTIDGTLTNDSDETVTSWKAAINIEGDCFINNAWTGTVEIHQYVGTKKEATQTLDLRSYDLEDVELDYLYDGDLLIPLEKGDYVIYNPSEKDELEIAPQDELTMGLIMYYLDDLNLSNYSINYYYHRDFTYGTSFIALIVLAALWLLLLVGTVVADLSYKRAAREFELRKTGLSSMSSIYSIISFINLQNDELVPVYADEKVGQDIPHGSGANAQIREIFARDTAAPYRAAVLDFVDTSTLPERLEKESVSHEYVSKTYGWTQARFFAVDRQEGQPLERVLFTIEDINDRKRELERFEEHSAQVELESEARNAFVVGVTNGMRPSVQAIGDLAGTIATETSDASVREHAVQIRNRGKLLTYLIDSTLDSPNIGSSIQPTSMEYELAEIVADAQDVAGVVFADRAFSYEADIALTIPKRLIGDARRIERVLIGMLIFAGRAESTTSVKLSAYGSKHPDGEHILFSVKADSSGMSAEDERLFSEFVSTIETRGTQALDENLKELEGIALLLMIMGSKLQVVNEPGTSLELYFEIEQQIADEPSDSVDGNAQDIAAGSAVS